MYYVLKVQRSPVVFDRDEATFGKMSLLSVDSSNTNYYQVVEKEPFSIVESKPIFDTIEPSPHDPFHPCIDAGIYKLTLNVRSPKFKRYLPRLLNVPFRSGILIHEGNSVSDTSGCILVGEKKGSFLVNSKKALNDLISFILKYNIEIIHVC